MKQNIPIFTQSLQSQAPNIDNNEIKKVNKKQSNHKTSLDTFEINALSPRIQ